jgi:hypothetical protein
MRRSAMRRGKPGFAHFEGHQPDALRLAPTPAAVGFVPRRSAGPAVESLHALWRKILRQ